MAGDMSKLLLAGRIQKYIPMLVDIEEKEFWHCSGEYKELTNHQTFKYMLDNFAKSSYADDNIRAKLKDMQALYDVTHAMGEKISDYDINWFGRSEEYSIIMDDETIDPKDLDLRLLMQSLLYNKEIADNENKFLEWYRKEYDEYA